MNRIACHRKKSFRALFLIALFFYVPAGLAAQAPVKVPITILHLNDMHGHLLPFTDKSVSEGTEVGGAAYLAEMIRQERAENPEGTLLLSAGDMFQGTPLSNVFNGQPVIEVMNYLKFDGMALGNHEFDWGRTVLSSLMASAAFPFLSSNIVDKDGKCLAGVKPYVILERKGVKVAVIGVTTPDTVYSTKPGNVSDLLFLDPAEAVAKEIEEVRRHGADFVVVLSHLGLDADRRLANTVPGIHVIVGGHSHTVITEPVWEGETLIVQAGYYGLYLGVLEIEVDTSTGKISRSRAGGTLRNVVAGPGAPKDEYVIEMVEKYSSRLKGEFDKVVGETAVDLLRDPSGESNIGNLLTDAMREASGSQIAFQNGGGIRADIPKGPISLEEIYTLLPFDNVLVTMNLTGAQLMQILERNALLDVRVLQVSGMEIGYDLTRPPGSRVVRASVGKEPLELQQVYTVSTNDFLAAGGDRFVTFREGTNFKMGEDLRNIVISYLQRHSPVNPSIENRMVFRK